MLESAATCLQMLRPDPWCSAVVYDACDESWDGHARASVIFEENHFHAQLMIDIFPLPVALTALTQSQQTSCWDTDMAASTLGRLAS